MNDFRPKIDLQTKVTYFSGPVRRSRIPDWYFPVRSRIPDRDKLVRSDSPEIQPTSEPVYSTQKFWWEPGDTAFKSYKEDHEKLVQFH